MKRVVAAALCTALLVCSGPIYAFDTFWHSAASGGIAGPYKFSADAQNVVQFGTFGPDFFGPLYDYVGKTGDPVFAQMRSLGVHARSAGEFMHFDNLYGEIDRDWKLDYLFRRLLENTRHTLKGWYQDGSLNEGNKKMLILITLGSSLHMVEDFYSHSNWTHFDFVKLGFPQKQSLWHQDYAPSWFEVSEQLGPPALDGAETWPIEVRTGVYEPKTKPPADAFGVVMDHTYMSHDNSQLVMEKAPRYSSHGFGAHPAKDAASATAHQLYAVNSAAMAAVEWVALLEQDPDVAAAINYAKGWNLAAYNKMMQKHLEDGLKSVAFLSCLPNKWDGPNPPKARKTECSVFNSGFALPSMLHEFWAAYYDHDVLEKLVQGIGDFSTKHYVFDKVWYAAHRPKDKAKVTIDLDTLGLQIDVPAQTTQRSHDGVVVLSGPAIGTMELAPQPTPTPVDQAVSQQPAKSPVKSSTDKDNYELIYAIPSGFKAVGQRTFGTHSVTCGGTGTKDQAHAIGDACKNLRLLLE